MKGKKKKPVKTENQKASKKEAVFLKWIQKPWILLLILIAATFIIYLPAINVPPYLDDNSAIVNNSRITDIQNQDIIFRDFFIGRGLTNLLYSLEWHYFSDPIKAMHVTSILFHLLAVILVYFASKSIWKFLYPEIAEDPNWKYYGLIAASVVALHPINTQCVTYVIARAGILATIFYLLGITIPLIGMRYLNSRGTNAIKTILATVLTVATIGACLMLGVACKEIAVTLPAAFMVLWICSWRKKSIATLLLRITLCTLPVLIAFGGFLLYRKSQMGGYLLIEDLQARSMTANLYTQICVIVLYYVPRILVPVNLLFRPPYALAETIFDTRFLFSLAIIIAVGIMVLKHFRKKPEYLFGYLWFFITLAPTSSILPLWDIIAERRLYLPMFGIAVVAESLFFALIKSDSFIPKKKIVAYTVSILVLFSSLTLFQNIEYQNPIRFWSREFAYSPYNLENLHNYLYRLAESGQDQKVQEVLQQLDWDRVREENKNIDTGSLDTLIRFMLNYRIEVDYAALLAQKNAEKFNKNLLLQNTYQLALLIQGKIDEAMNVIEQTLQIDPNHIDTLLNKSLILRAQGQFAASQECLDRARSVAPNYLPVLEEQLELDRAQNKDTSALEKRIRDIQANSKYVNEIGLKSSI